MTRFSKVALEVNENLNVHEYSNKDVEPEFWNDYRPKIFSYADQRPIIVYQGKNLGDVLLTTPLIEVLRRSTSAPLVICASESSRSIVDDPARGINWIKRQKRLPAIISSAMKLRQLKPQMFVDLHGSFDSSLSSFIIRAPTSIKMGGLAPRLFDYYNYSVPHRSGCRRHRADMHLDVLRRLGIHIQARDIKISAGILLNNLDERLQSKLEKKFNRPYVVIHPVSRWLFKTPNPSFWLALIERLRYRLDCDVFLTGLTSGVEGEFVEYVSKESSVPIVGGLTLPELAFVLRNSSGYIGVDTFVSHLASAFDVGGIVIFGPSDEMSWGPLSKNISVVTHKEFACRPCNIDGCGGGKRSDCLNMLDPSRIADQFIGIRSKYGSF